MRLDSLLLADAAEDAAGQKLTIIGGGVTRASSHQLPFVVRNLVAVARFLLDGSDHDHSVAVQVRGRNQETGDLWFEGAPQNLPEEYRDRGGLAPGEENGVFFIVNLDGIQ